MADKKNHIKQIGLKMFSEDITHLEKISKSNGFKFDSDAIRFALEFTARTLDREIQKDERIFCMEEKIKKLAESVDSISWRNNDSFILTSRIAKHLNIPKE